MDSLEYDVPRKEAGLGRIHKDYINEIDDAHYERGCSVITKYGIVLVSEIKWETNGPEMLWTHLATVINGVRYSAWLKKAKLSDFRIRWWATHFIKKIVTKDVPSQRL